MCVFNQRQGSLISNVWYLKVTVKDVKEHKENMCVSDYIFFFLKTHMHHVV